MNMEEISRRFENQWSANQIEEVIKSLHDFFRGLCRKSHVQEGRPLNISETEQRSLGGKVFDTIVASIDTSAMTSFQKFLFWTSQQWWFYDPRFREEIEFSAKKACEYACVQLTRFLIPAMPDEVYRVVSRMDVANVAVNFGHFAILFEDSREKIRRIVTNAELFELRGVYGYTYLDISPEGRPFAKCIIDAGGGRAFFDGVRLMTHEKFRTCAPKVAFLKGGYVVNSTGVTIVNGTLFPLIEEGDEVAHTTGTEPGSWGPNFTHQQAIQSFRLTDEKARRLVVKDDGIYLGERLLKPLGFFDAGCRRELKNGFTLCEQATFHENLSVLYDHIIDCFVCG